MDALLSFRAYSSDNNSAGSDAGLTLLPGLALLVLVNLRPLHKYIRSAVAPSVTAAVKQQMQWLASIQSKKSPLMDALAHASATSVTVEFYVALLPLLFWLGWQEVAMKLLLGLSICCFVCFAWKDLLCCPRPRHIVKLQRNPAVVVKENNPNDIEYGAPSGHVALSVCLNFYLINELVQYGIMSQEAADSMHITSGLWIIWIAYGRMYLGVHTPVDLFTGCLMGLSMYGLWSRLDELCLQWLLTNNNAVLYSLIGFSTMIFQWPTGDEYTTSFLEAGVSFLGAAFGAVWVVNKYGVVHSPIQLAALQGPKDAFVEQHSTAAFAAKLLVGYATVLVTKTASKKALRSVLPVLLDQVPAAVRKLWLPYCTRSDCFNGSLASKPAGSDADSCAVPTKPGGLAWDVEVVAKFLNYACVVLAVKGACSVFELVGL
jgi:membrane-associated phospholipid phosphatase